MNQAAGEKPTGAKFSTLILEDDPICAGLVAGLIEAEGGEAVIRPSLAEARTEISRRVFDLFMLDYQLPDGKGNAFYYELRDAGQLAPAIMLTAYPHIPVAVELTRDGLFDYLTKPFEPEDLTTRLRQAVQRLKSPESDWGRLAFVARSPNMRGVHQLIHQAAANPAATVLLTGETGTGKDLAARSIHEQTFLNAKPMPAFVCLNCPTLPAEMFEAELFGAEKGSYTGAYQQRTGLVEAAEGGTLFLDEISEVPLLLQAKLLQVLETRIYRRLGSTDSRRFNGRIIAASNKVLAHEVEQGRFRADLWYRLDVFSLHLPPLRERVEDLPEIVETLLDQLAQKYQRKKPSIKPKDLAVLEHYDFPGNIRELRNLVERSLLQTPVQESWLQIDPVWLAQARTRARPSAGSPVAATTEAGEEPTSPLEAQERALIQQALEKEGGVIRRAAAKLGLSHQALLRRLKKWPELRQYTSSQPDEAP